MADYTTNRSTYDGYGGKTQVVSGQAFKTNTEKHLDVPKTKSDSVKADGMTMGTSRYRMMNPNRPLHQNAYRTISGAAMGKAAGWQTRGDQKKKVLGRAYSMNQVSMARIMKGNVNANEGAYLRRGGNAQS